jgi:hypothetical protein
MSTLLSIPLEIRLIIYDYILRGHRDTIVANTQPSNDHLLLLHACRQIEHEAELAGFRTYLSLRHELEISAFLEKADPRVLPRITHLDVANDGRLVQRPRDDENVSGASPYPFLSPLCRRCLPPCFVARSKLSPCLDPGVPVASCSREAAVLASTQGF